MFKIVIVFVLFILLIIYFLFIEPKVNKFHISNKNEYGSARFSTFDEIKKNFIVENIKDINNAGFPIWYSKNNDKVWFDMETPHYVYLGSTGSGKSVTCVIPTCSFIASAKDKRSVFITDPKGEIYHKTSSMFSKNGYDIYTIDFRNPELSNKINLLEPIIKEYKLYIEYDNQKKDIENQNNAMKHLAETNRLITSLSSMIMTDKVADKDPFWNNSARNLLEGLIALYLEEYRDGKITKEQITLNSIKKFQNSSMEESNFEILKEYIEKKPYGLKSKDSLLSIFSSAENTYKSIVATFSEKMSLFDDVNVANITSYSDFEFDALGKKPTAIYIIVPDEDKTYYSLVTIIVGLLYRELVKLANSNDEKRLPVNIDWLLDEFANCPPLPDIEAIVSVARSRGMRFHFFIQSLSQLDNVYGKDVAQIIMDNCGLVYLKTNTQDTAEAISKRLGKQTIESNSLSQNISKKDYGGNKSVSLMGRDLMTPEEVKELHYKTIIFPIIGHPILRDTVVYNKFSCYLSGEEKRKVNSLKDLYNTYYTVEKMVPKNNKPRVVDPDDFYDDIKKLFVEINEKIQNILDNQKFIHEFKTNNGFMYSCFQISNLLSGEDKEKIEKLESESFHIEIKEVKDNTNICIYKN